MKIILLFTIIFLLLAAFAIITSGSGEKEQTKVCVFPCFIDTSFGITLHVLVLCVQRWSNALPNISPDRSKKSQDIGSIALLGHKAEYHYHSLEPVVSTRSSQSAVDFLIDKYGERKITEDYCSEKKYQSVSSGIHVSEGGCVWYYCDNQTVCDLCQFMETHPDVME